MELQCKEKHAQSEKERPDPQHTEPSPQQPPEQYQQQKYSTYLLRTAPADKNLLQDNRVLQNMLDLEDRYMPSPSIFRCIQKDIEPWMRNKVATWMLEVCEEEKCEEEVFPTSMNYMDKFLSVVNIKRTQLQLLGAVCMFIASKLRETLPLNATRLVIYTDHSVTVDQLLEWELLVLQVLKWDISTITPHDFLHQITNRLPLCSEDANVVRRHSQTFIALSIATDFSFALFPPSMIAAASVSSAIQGLLGVKWCTEIGLKQRLQAITGIDYDCLHSCQEQIEKTLSRNLPQAVDNPQEGTSSLPSTPEKGIPLSQPTTPTDVRDIDFS